MSEKPKAASTFSGVGGIDLGFEKAGFEVVAQCEKDNFRRQVLRRHWPDVAIYDDIKEIQGERGKVQIVFGGFPCQDLSVAGKRAGMREGTRSGLFFEFARVADESLDDGGWILLENVPGLFSSHEGEDFQVLQDTLAELGFHDIAWRVLDSRYFGVPQRRKRVFILARRASGTRAREVLLEPEGGGGHPTEGRKARKKSARSAGNGTQAASSPVRAGDGVIASALDRMAGGADDNDAQANHIVPGHAYGVSSADPDVAGTLGAKGKGGGGLGFDREGAFVTGEESPTLRSHVRNNSNPITEAAMLVASPEEATTLTSGSHDPSTNRPGRRREDDTNIVAFNMRGRDGGSQAEVDEESLVNLRAAQGGSSRTYVARVDSEDDISEAVTTKWKKGSGGPSGDEMALYVDATATGFNWQSGGDVRLQPLEGESPTLQRQQVPATFVEPEARLYNPYRTSLGKGNGFVEGFKEDEIHDALTSQNPPKGRPVVVEEKRNYVRRLTPTECERLQGFPDGWTLLDGESLVDTLAWYEDPEYRHVWGWDAEDPLKQDGRRYAAMGDAVTVPVAHWIANRLITIGFND